MKITEFISKKAIIADLKAKDKKSAVQELVKIVKSAYGLTKLSVNEVASAVLEREKVGSTGIGRGIALPHAKTPQVAKLVGAFGRSVSGIPFESVDGEPAHLVFLILAPDKKDFIEPYHKAIQVIMEGVRVGTFCNFLRGAKTVKDLEEVFKDSEELIKV
jgi:mannitol/fructose-specific phosphotransferase system IIA component (Ntr-type)